MPGRTVPFKVDLGGVTELRVHGVGGTTAASLLFTPNPTLVAGDEDAGFYRRRDWQGRHMEAYSWGNLTSRATSRALWMLLLPFTLVNVAGWSQRLRGDDRQHRDPTTTGQGRLVALLAASLTVLVVVGVAYVAYDPVAVQCGGIPRCANEKAWMKPFTLDWMADHPGRRLAVGSLVPLGLVLLLVGLGRRTRRLYESRLPPEEVSDDETLPVLARRSAWRRASEVRAMSSLHLAMAVSTVGWTLGLATLAFVEAGEDARVLAGIATVIGILVTTTAALELSSTERAGGRALQLFAFGTLGLALAAALTAPAQALDDIHVPLSGISRANEAVFGLQLVLLLALGIVAVVHSRAPQHPELRSFRWMAPVVLAGLGILLTGATLAGLNVRIADVLGQPVQGDATDGAAVVIHYPGRADAAALLLGAVVLLVAAAGAVWWLVTRRVSDDEAAGVIAEFDIESTIPAEQELDRGWAKGLVRARRLAQAVPDLDQYASLLVLITLVVSGAWLLMHVVDGEGGGAESPLPERLGFLVTGATWLVASLPVLGVGAIRAARTKEGVRRQIGILWDLGTFWPRWFHPWAPPCYAERAVPDLQHRIAALTRTGAVILSAHSQGTILASAAVRGLDDDIRRRVALVTYGSPLAYLYPRTFPNSFLPSPVGDADLHSWDNYWRDTDPIGGPVLAWPQYPVPRPNNVQLQDPPAATRVPGGTLPKPGGHSHYLEDPVLLARFRALTSELQALF